MRHTALTRAVVWACVWVFFETAEAVGSHDFMQAIILAVVMFGAVVVAWKWPAAGGVLLVLAAMAATAMFAPAWLRTFGIWPLPALFATMPLPPLAAGILLLLSRHEHHPVRAHPA